MFIRGYANTIKESTIDNKPYHNGGKWFLEKICKQMHTFVHKVNGGERCFFTYYSKIMEKIIKNCLNYIQNICIIKKRFIFYSNKPYKRRIYQLIFLCLCTKSLDEKGDRQEVGICLRFIAKLRRQILIS